jgi:membrane protein
VVSTPPGAPEEAAIETSRSRSLTVVKDLVRGMRAHGALDSARLMAFDFFLSIVPLLVMLGYVLGRLVRRRGVEALVGPLLETMPNASADLARHEIERLAGHSSASLAPLSAATFLWLASSGIHKMMDVFEVAARATPRPWWKQRFMAVLSVLVGVAALAATSWGLVAWDDRIHQGDAVAAPALTPSSSAMPTPSPSAVPKKGRAVRDSRLPSSSKRGYLLTRVHSPWERVFAAGVVLVVGMLGLAVFYRFAVEHPVGIRRRAWPGTLAAIGTWLVVSWVFGTYLGSLGNYAVYYGSLAAVAVLLVWLFLTSVALLLGAEVNAMLEGVGAHE